jgi:hypothetical protein
MRFATRAISVFGLVAVTAASVPAAVTINEMKLKGVEFIELYNSGPAAVDVTGWTLNDGTGPEVLAGVIAAGGFKNVATTLGLDNSGAVVELRDASGVLVDRVGYGNRGGAPLGFNSTGRFPDGDDTDDDARDFEYVHAAWNAGAETPGAPNVQGAPNLGSTVLLNEIAWQGDNVASFDAIELYNPTAAPVSVQGWWVSDADGFCQIQNAIVVPAGGWAVLNKGDAGEGMDCLSFEEIAISGSDCMYLFYQSPLGGQPVRVDQLGLDTNGPGAGLGETYQRCEDGAGPNDGYDYPSSGGGATYYSGGPTLGGTNNGLCTVQGESSTWGRVKGLYR